MNKVKLLVIIIILLISTSIFSKYAATKIYTPNGTPITVYESTNDLNFFSRIFQNWYFKITYPKAEMLRSSSKKYNCHSYAWYSVDEDNSIWINTPGDDMFWKDGSYIEIEKAFVRQGAKVSYASDDHSAIYEEDDHFISKWGQGPLVFHAYDYCPYKSHNLRYFELNE